MDDTDDRRRASRDKVINIRIDSATHAAWKTAAEARNMSVSEFVRRAAGAGAKTQETT